MLRLKLFENYALVIFFVFLALALCFPTQSYDLFFYLSMGRRFFETGSMPELDPFVFTVRTWHIHHEWLAYVFYYVAYWIGGLVGVTLLKAAVWMGLFFLLAREARRARVPDTLALCILVLVLWACSQRFMEKASLFSDLFLIGLTALLLGRRELSKKWLIALPLVFLVWVNLHPGYVLGGAVYAAFIISKGRRATRAQWASLVACFLACLLNPEFLTGALYPLKTAFSADWSLHRKSNSEWMPTFRFPYIQTWQVQSLLVVLVATLAPLCGALVRWKAAIQARAESRAEISSELVFAVFIYGLYFYLAYDAVRFISTSALGVGLLFFFLWGRAGWTWSSRWEQVPRFLWAVGFVVLSVMMCRGPYGFNWGLPPRTVGFGLDREAFPVGATAFIKANNLQGRIFNQYGWGSFLIWELNRTDFLLIHGHVDDPKVLGLEYEGATQSEEVFNQVVNKYNIQYFLLEKDPAPAMLGFLSRWKLIYQDARSALWMR